MANSNEYMRAYMANRRATRRTALLELKGNKCERCGSVEDLQFDHRDNSSRLFVLSGKGLDGPWKNILLELEKCDLLCHPCHREKTIANGETGGGANKVTKHGTEAMHRAHKCNCNPCRIAAYEARVRRGELRGHHGRPYKLPEQSGVIQQVE